MFCDQLAEAGGGSPFMRVVRGNPDAEEIAAVVTVLLSANSAAPPTGTDQAGSGWAAYWRRVKAPLAPGPGSWQAAVRDW